MRTQTLFTTVFLNFLSATAGVANNEPPDSGWEIEGQIGVENEAAYAGSDVYLSEFGGELTATYQDAGGNDYFIGLGEVGTRLAIGVDWTLSAKLEYEEGRDNASAPILAGFRTVADTVEGQFALIRRFERWSIGAAFQPDLLRRGKGLVYFVGAGHERPFFGRARLLASWDVSWGDAEHMDTEFGVNARESLASGLAQYRPSSGLKSTTFALEASWPLTRASEVIVGFAVERYLGAASKSPLVDEAGNVFTYEAGLAIAFDLL